MGVLRLDAKLLNDGHPTVLVVSRSAKEADIEALKSKPNVEVV